MPTKARKPRPADRRANPREGTSKQGIFHFVSVNPSSETQKSENRSVIRSHASKYIWRQHRAVRGGNKTSKLDPNDEELTESPIEPSPTAKSECWSPDSEYVREDGSLPNDSPVNESRPFEAKDEEMTEADTPCDGSLDTGDYCYDSESDAASESELSQSTQSSPIVGPWNQLVQHLQNPHRPSNLEDSAVSKLMKYAVCELWPGLALGSNGQKWGEGIAAKEWMPLALENDALYSAFLYGAAGHMQVRRRLESPQAVRQTQEEAREQIICERETIEVLNKAINRRDQTNPLDIYTDEIILAVLCMAFNKVDNRTWDTPDSSPKAPLRNLQWINVYGGLSLNEVHIQGLLALIERRGGLGGMQLPGLAEVLSTSGIMLATKEVAKSRLPFIPIYPDTAKGKTPRWPKRKNTPSLDQESEIQLSNILFKAKLPREIAKVMIDMRNYTEVVNLYSQGVLDHLELAVIADRRNFIQFNLICLPRARELGDEFSGTYRTYDSCRLAAIIYSVVVVFPLPAARRPYDKLSKSLRLALIASGFPEEWTEPFDFKPWTSSGSLDLLLWVLVMGGIAAARTRLHEWFSLALIKVANLASVSKWEDLKIPVSRIIWMESVCDLEGQNVWGNIAKWKSPASPLSPNA